MADPASKTCMGPCGLMKPLTEFVRHPNGRDGLASRCRDCRAAYRRHYRETNYEKYLEDKRRYRENNPEAVRATQARWASNLKAKVTARYGPRGVAACWCCGTTENLSIDHVNGGGTAHRKELFGPLRHGAGGQNFYLWLVKEGFPEGYQTLCVPCNGSKSTGERCTLQHDNSR